RSVALPSLNITAIPNDPVSPDRRSGHILRDALRIFIAERYNSAAEGAVGEVQETGRPCCSFWRQGEISVPFVHFGNLYYVLLTNQFPVQQYEERVVIAAEDSRFALPGQIASKGSFFHGVDK